jgi:hypothetical protein
VKDNNGGLMIMKSEEISDIFTPDVLQQLFPEDRTDQFFDALYGDAAEGTYDISLKFKSHRPNRLEFELHLLQRPGKCLQCSLTYGLPQVFSRHPVIDINGLVGKIDQLLNARAQCDGWQIGSTREKSDELHTIPLTILLRD